jgi:hypothetical protein
VEALANVTSHNARAVQIRKFVATPPARATTLRLVTAEDPPQTLGEWDVTQARGNGSLAIEISTLLEEHTTTIQRHTEAVLGWMVGDSKVVASKRLRARFTPPPDDADEGDGLSWEALGINGSTTGQVIQMQRHVEVREKTSNTLIHGLINTALEMNAQLREQLQDARERNRELEQQLSDLAAAEYQQWRAQVPENDNAGAIDPAAEARTNAINVISGIAQQFGPTIIQAALVRLTSPKSAIAIAPPSSPPAPISPAAPPNLSPTGGPTAVPPVVVTAAPPASTAASPARAPARAPRPPPQRVPVGRAPVRGRK